MGGAAASSSCRLLIWCGWASSSRSRSRSMSTSGCDINMLLRISLASLDGPLDEVAVVGGERADELAPERLSREVLARCGSWATWCVLR
jgi:hypothetical protein